MTKQRAPNHSDLPLEQVRRTIDAIDTCAIFVLDAEAKVLAQNQTATQLTHGEDSAGWLNGAFHAVEDKQRLTGTAHPLHRAVSDPSDAAPLVGWLDADGGERIFEFRWTDLAGSSFGLLSIQEHTDLWVLRSFNQQSANMPSKDVLSSVTHEMGNIFGIVHLAADNLSRQALDETGQGNVQDIWDACERGTELAQSLSNPDGPEPSKDTVTDVTATVAATAKLVQRVLPAKLVFNAHIPSASYLSACHKGELEAVLLQVLSHARKAVVGRTDINGMVSIRLAQRDGLLDIVIENNASGIAQDATDTPKDPYANTQRMMHGSGTNLVAADTFARRSGGALEIGVADNGGLRVTLSLPELDGSGVNTTQRHDAPDVTASLEGYRVLLAESEPHMRRILTEALRYAGATVAAVESGSELTHTLDHSPNPDVVIMVPRLADGVSVRDVVQRPGPVEHKARIIVLTGTPDAESVLGPGLPILVLHKPIQMEALKNAICLRPPAGP